MSNPQPELYDIYAAAFGKVRSGKVLDKDDYTYRKAVTYYEKYDTAGSLAVTIAVDDVKKGHDLRTKADFEAEHARLLGG